MKSWTWMNWSLGRPGEAESRRSRQEKERSSRNFLEKLSSHDWTVKDSYLTHPANNWKSLDVIIESVVDLIFTMPEMKAVLMGQDFFFVKSAGASGTVNDNDSWMAI